jgi:predicted PurR-regulated permease PerM
MAARPSARQSSAGAERAPVGVRVRNGGRSLEEDQSSAARWQRLLYMPLTVLAWLALAIIALWLIGHLAHTVLMVALAVIITIALQPLVAVFKQRLSRPLAVAGAYLVGLAIVLGLGLLLIMTAAQQVVALVQNLPDYAKQAQALEPRLLLAVGRFGLSSNNLQAINQQFLAGAQSIGGSLAAGSLGVASSVASVLIDAVLVLILSIYFMLSGPAVVTWLQESPPGNLRAPARFAVQTVSQVIGGYVRGTLTMALLIGTMVGVGLGILGVPYAVLLGVLAFFMEFIPVVGVLISGVVSLLVALSRGPVIVLVVLVYFIVVHVIESDVVGPRVLGRAVGIHPATGIIALLAGSELFGVWGALFAAPLAGLLQATVMVVYRGLRDEHSSVLASVVAASEAAIEAKEPAAAAAGAATAADSGKADAAGAAAPAEQAEQAAAETDEAAKEAMARGGGEARERAGESAERARDAAKGAAEEA